MTKVAPASGSTTQPLIRTTFLAAAVLVMTTIIGGVASAQNIQFTQGSVGSGLENSLTVPIRTYPGRGATSLPINLYYSSKVWRMKHVYTPAYSWGECGNSVVETRFGEYSTAGWKTSLDIPGLEWPDLS